MCIRDSLSQPGQGLQGQGAAAVIEVGQGIVQHQGTGLLRREHQLAHRQTHRQVELVGGTLGEGQRPPGLEAVVLLRQGLKLLGKGHLVVFPAGELRQQLPRPAVEGRGEPGLEQMCIRDRRRMCPTPR